MSGEGEDVDKDIEEPTACKIKTSSEVDSAFDIIDKNKLANNQRCSNRLTKRPKRETSPVDSNVKLKPVIASSVKQISTIGSKTRRPWELWSVEDKNAFFEALCEFGKDFESIQSYIAQRSKKKGVAGSMIKNKDQVRHFYYRTWHKISKFLQISESVGKQTQELYGLINYAELRKKIGVCLNEKNRQKLNELVFTGVTTIKHKGKKVRIKTPVCRALKKLNDVAETSDPEKEKLPKEIIVEFRPHTNSAWLQVQNLAQNPRISTKVCLQRRLKSVIEYLQDRWKPYRLKRKEHLSSSLPNPLTAGMSCDNPPVLRVKPAREAKIYPLTLSIMNMASSSDVCLEKYIKLFHEINPKDINKNNKSIGVVRLSPKIQTDCAESLEKVVTNEAPSTGVDNQSDVQEICLKIVNKTVNEDVNYINVLTPPKSVPEEVFSEQVFCDVQKSASISSPVTIKNVSTFAEDIVNEKNQNSSELNFRTFDQSAPNLAEISKICQLVSEYETKKDSGVLDSKTVNITFGDYIMTNVKNDSSTVSVGVDKSSSDVLKNESISTVSDSIYCKTVRNGWTAEESGFLTFGELYLLLGKPSIIVLEYEFEPSSSGKVFENLDSPDSKGNCLNEMLKIAHAYVLDSKNKQVFGKQRTSSKNTKAKVCSSVERSAKDVLLTDMNSETNIPDKENYSFSKENSALKSSSANAAENSVISSDKHVFAKPIGTAPRTAKPPDQNSLKEELGKLLPGTRRGCRVRRKPLVVQRPLLPRDGIPRPMTVVHFVPSISPLTTVLPSTCAQTENKINITSAKKVVQIIPSGSSVDLQPIQVPIIEQIQTDPCSGLIFQQNTLSSSNVMINSPSGNTVQHNVTCMKPADIPVTSNDAILPSQKTENHTMLSETGIPPPPCLDALNFGILPESQSTSVHADENYSSLQQMSLLDSSNSVGLSFLDDYPPNPNIPVSQTPTCFNEDSISAIKRNTPPNSPSNQPFRINSPEIQWFNGESTELSFNTLLNSVESPSKLLTSSTSILSAENSNFGPIARLAPVSTELSFNTLLNSVDSPSKLLTASTSSLSTENSNFDPIARLAPVVDSQVRCLLDECSIDFITKFEDLADVINNSSSNDNKPA